MTEWLIAGGLALWALGGRMAGKNVFDRHLAAGVHPSLIALLDLWDKEGWFPVRVSSWSGGLRTDAAAQAAQAAGGLSNATTLKQTPHGRGAALDIWPLGFNPNAATLSEQPEAMDRMYQFAEWAKSKGGFVAGKDWVNFKTTPAQKAGADPAGDWPHLEIANWQSLPYPPPNYGTTGDALS